MEKPSILGVCQDSKTAASELLGDVMLVWAHV